MAAFNLGDILVSAASQKLKSLTKSFRNLNIGGITSALGFRLTQEVPGITGSWQELALNRPDPQMEFDWEVVIFGPNGEPFPPEYVEEIDCPNVQIDVDRIFRGGSYVKMAKYYDVPSMNIVFYEDNRATTYGFFRSWFETVFTPEGYSSPLNQYKGSITVRPKDALQNIAVTLNYSGVFPVNFPNIKLGSSSNRITHSVEFSVDSLDVSYDGAGLGSGANTSVEEPLLNKIGRGIQTVNRVVSGVQNVAHQLDRFF